jgi:hypothetical protein
MAVEASPLLQQQLVLQLQCGIGVVWQLVGAFAVYISLQEAQC